MKSYACVALLLAAGCATGPTLGRHSPSMIFMSAKPEATITPCVVRAFGTPETVASTQVAGGYFLVAPFSGLEYVEASVTRKLGEQQTQTLVRSVRLLRPGLATMIAACM